MKSFGIRWESTKNSGNIGYVEFDWPPLDDFLGKLQMRWEWLIDKKKLNPHASSTALA